MGWDWDSFVKKLATGTFFFSLQGKTSDAEQTAFDRVKKVRKKPG